jgi:hypothetical protein
VRKAEVNRTLKRVSPIPARVLVHRAAGAEQVSMIQSEDDSKVGIDTHR